MSLLPRCVGVLLFLCGVSALAGMIGCESSSAPPPRTQTAPQKQPGEPLVRVRLSAGLAEVTFLAPTKLQISDPSRPNEKTLVPTPVTLTLASGVWSGTQLPSPLPPHATLEVAPLGPAPVQIGDRRYAGVLRLVPARDARTSAPTDRFDVVNHLPMDSYLPGVLDQELYDHWHASTYIAQAIAARTYAIDRIIDEGPGRHYDVEAGQASQAYIGVATHPLARRAVADTAGLVLTDRGKIFTAFYSSTCGGVPISPRQAFGNDVRIPALEPTFTCDWCRSSKHRNWGPITQERVELSRRIAAWGRYHGLSIAQLATIRSIEPSEVHLGRTVRFTITDSAGKVYALRGESLRTAANFAWSEAKISPPKQKLPSGFVKVAIEGETVRFSEGHGFGHGVGLCQFGAEGMAVAGRDPTQILSFYYPGAKVERAY